MSEASNLIDLSMDDTMNTTNILQISLCAPLNNNPSNEILTTPAPVQYPILRTCDFITSDVRNSLDNNPFDRIQKEANLQDDPFEIVFNEPNENNNIKNEVITENILLLSDDNNTEYNLDVPKISNFSRFRLGSTNSNGLLSSISSIGSTSSVFNESENISLINDDLSSKFNKGFTTENTFRTSSLNGIDNKELNDVGEFSLQTTNDNTIHPTNSNKNESETILDIKNDSNKINSYSDSLQKCDSFILNQKFVEDSSIASQMSKVHIASQNNLNLSENIKENLMKNIFSTPENQSTPNNSQVIGSSSGSSISSQSVQMKYNKIDLRNRLLKLSISNSSINSPLASFHRNSKTSDDGSSVELSVFNEASNLAELYSKLITNSPSRNTSEDSCDDLMSIKPNWIDSKSDIDSDLELMNIPILAEIDKSKMNNSIERNDIDETNIAPVKKEESLNHDIEKEKLTSNLDKLKKKMKEHKIKNTSQDINELINGLRGLIFECTQDEKKIEASSLLESLSSLIGDDIDKSNSKIKKCSSSTSKISKTDNKDYDPPQPIIRQGTFDLDLNNTGTTETLNLNDDDSQHNIEPELVDIVEEIGKLVGQFGTQNVSIVTTNLNQNSANGQSVNANPTYIVVMSTPSKRKSLNMENSPNMRRRSQSLSLHDKKLKLTTINSSINTMNHDTSLIKECPTPVRSKNLVRRNSISTTTITPVRRSIYAQTSTNTHKLTTPQQQRRSMLIETTKNKPSSSNAKNKPSSSNVNIRKDLNTKQIKFKTVNKESAISSKGPLKATVPLKQITPILVTSSVNDEARQIYNKPVTSTPNPIATRLSYNRGFPKACLTPTITVTSSTTDIISPSRNSIKNNSTKYSFTSTTSIGNLSVQSSSVGHKLRRKSFTDSKSPIKRLLDQKDLKLFKFGNRTAVSKPNVPTTLNKENKQPRFGI